MYCRYIAVVMLVGYAAYIVFQVTTAGHRVRACARAHVCVPLCVCALVRVRARVCVCALVRVRARV